MIYMTTIPKGESPRLKTTLELLALIMVMAAALYIGLSIPTVEVDAFTKECVRVPNSDYTCDNLPERYNSVSVAPEEYVERMRESQ